MAKKTKNRKAKASTPKDICFILMPFGGWLDGYYETIYIPAVEAAGLEPHRADDLFRPSTIVNDIWAYTRRAKLLLADLSGRNPNVFYELGLAHALAKPAILVAESMDEIPFDLRALRIIIYDKNAPDWGRLLGGKVTAAIKEVLKSPVEAVLPAFLSVKGDTTKPTVSVQEKELIEIKQDLESLRREVRGSQPTQLSLSEGPRVEVQRVTSSQARQYIQAYVQRGIPEDMILRRMAEFQVPADWVLGTIRDIKAHEMKGRKRHASTPRSRQKKERR